MRERTPQELKALDRLSLADHVSRFISDQQFERLIEAFAGIYMVIGPRQSSAGEFVLCLSTHIREKTPSYPLGGMRAVPLAYLRSTEKRGGEVRYSSPVRRIVVEGGRARQREVAVGPGSGLLTEIVAGLEEGDSVIVHPGDAVADGVRVRSFRAE